MLKFLVDAQATRTFVSQLRALGYDVQWVAEVPGLRSADDVTVLAAAQSEGRVLLSFDLFRGQTRRRMYQALVANGGMIVTIAGGPEQSASARWENCSSTSSVWNRCLANPPAVPHRRPPPRFVEMADAGRNRAIIIPIPVTQHAPRATICPCG